MRAICFASVRSAPSENRETPRPMSSLIFFKLSTSKATISSSDASPNSTSLGWKGWETCPGSFLPSTSIAPVATHADLPPRPKVADAGRPHPVPGTRQQGRSSSAPQIVPIRTHAGISNQRTRQQRKERRAGAGQGYERKTVSTKSS